MCIGSEPCAAVPAVHPPIGQLFAIQAVISMAIFAVMANALFSFGLGIAEDREKPWDPYLLTLPVPGVSRVLGYVFSIGLIGLVAVLPVIALGGLFTAAASAETFLPLSLPSDA